MMNALAAAFSNDDVIVVFSGDFSSVISSLWKGSDSEAL